MRFGIILSFLFGVLLISAPNTQAQYRQNDELHASHGKFSDDRVSPNRNVETAFGNGKIVLEWGAPAVKDRDLYGRLIPSGKVWRTGANEATVIHFEEDVMIEGQPLEAGNYSLFSIGSLEEWTFIFNKVQYTWGAFTYDQDQDALRVYVVPEMAAHQEELEFSFVDTDHPGTMVRLNWGAIQVGFDVAPGD